MKDAHIFFRNRTFVVTAADVRTPTMIYPIVDSIGRVRKDILIGGMGVALLIGIALAVYWDILYLHERTVLFSIIAAAVVIATNFSVLQVEARGYPARLYIARRSTIRKVFDAITEARAHRSSAPIPLVLEDGSSE